VPEDRLNKSPIPKSAGETGQSLTPRGKYAFEHIPSTGLKGTARAQQVGNSNRVKAISWGELLSVYSPAACPGCRERKNQEMT